MSISMKRYNDTIITPKDDRILFDQIFDDYGLIYGGSATMAASNKIHVGAARGFVKGTEVIIEAEDIAVNLSDSGTKNGRLKIVMDLADTETPIKFESEVASSFPALEQDANINYDNGRYEVVFATYKATETTISSVTLVMPTMQSVKAKMQGITQSLTTENGTKFRFGQNSDGEYGYIINKDGADTVIPFKKETTLELINEGNGGFRTLRDQYIIKNENVEPGEYYVIISIANNYQLKSVSINCTNGEGQEVLLKNTPINNAALISNFYVARLSINETSTFSIIENTMSYYSDSRSAFFIYMIYKIN